MLIAVPEPRSKSGCATCTTARCCVVFDPEMTGADLHRLVRGNALAPRDIAQLHPVRADQAEGLGLRFDDDGCLWELRLRRTALAPADADGGAQRCGFLVSLGPGVNRCGAYAHRPMVCRTFPSELTSLGVMVGNPPTICPPDAWSQVRADLVGLRQLHLMALAERELHLAFVTRWNEVVQAASPGARRYDKYPATEGAPNVGIDKFARLECVASAMLAYWDAVAGCVAAPQPRGEPAVIAALAAIS